MLRILSGNIRVEYGIHTLKLYKHIQPLTKFLIELRIGVKIKKSLVNQADNCDRSHSVYDICLLHYRQLETARVFRKHK